MDAVAPPPHSSSSHALPPSPIPPLPLPYPFTFESSFPPRTKTVACGTKGVQALVIPVHPMNSDQGLGAKAKAISGRAQKLLQGPNGLKLGFSALSLVLLLMYSIIHIFNKDVLLIVSLFAELVRLFGVLIITLNLRQKSGGSKATNISLMSQKFYLVVFGTRLIFKLFYEDFDFIYVLVETSALTATAYIVYMLTSVANRDAPSTPDPEAKCIPCP